MLIWGWLQGNPLYAPASVTFYLAAGDGAHEVESARQGPFQVQAHAELQSFAFEPALCVGGELLVRNAVHSVLFGNTVAEAALWYAT